MPYAYSCQSKVGFSERQLKWNVISEESAMLTAKLWQNGLPIESGVYVLFRPSVELFGD